MTTVDSVNALTWHSYSVRASSKGPLLEFIVKALERRECRILHASSPDRAPFYIVMETPSGERHGVLIYAFLANSRPTINRPQDEHRFQIKYGSDLKSGVLEVAVDPFQLITTLFIGVDLERDLFVSIDPLLNTPAPMSRSVEFKASHVEQILDDGWAAWERERRPGKAKSRPTVDLEDCRTEVLIGGKQERLLNLIEFERLARGLDPGARYLLADKFFSKDPINGLTEHPLLTELDVEPRTLFDLIQSAKRLKVAVRGWVAEEHLFSQLTGLDGVTKCERIEVDGRPDISFVWKDRHPIEIECKNTLRTTYANGDAKVDFQKTRAAKGNPCSRYYSADDFPILAACLHSVTEAWEFKFALTNELPAHSKCVGRLSNTVRVEHPIFVDVAAVAFDKLVEAT